MSGQDFTAEGGHGAVPLEGVPAAKPGHGSEREWPRIPAGGGPRAGWRAEGER